MSSLQGSPPITMMPDDPLPLIVASSQRRGGLVLATLVGMVSASRRAGAGDDPKAGCGEKRDSAAITEARAERVMLLRDWTMRLIWKRALTHRVSARLATSFHAEGLAFCQLKVAGGGAVAQGDGLVAAAGDFELGCLVLCPREVDPMSAASTRSSMFRPSFGDRIGHLLVMHEASEH